MFIVQLLPCKHPTIRAGCLDKTTSKSEQDNYMCIAIHEAPEASTSRSNAEGMTLTLTKFSSLSEVGCSQMPVTPWAQRAICATGAVALAVAAADEATILVARLVLDGALRLGSHARTWGSMLHQ